MLQTKQNDYTRTHGRTDLVTSSLLELLIAAKNELAQLLDFNPKTISVILDTFRVE